MNLAIITPAESDIILAQYSDWLALTDIVKAYHIEKASLYVQTNWTCLDVDYADDLTIPEEVDKATAYYAYASYSGNLYGDVTTVDDFKGNLRSIKSSVGDLSEETSWYKSGKVTPDTINKALGYPNALMSVNCTAVSAAVTLLRV